MRKLVFTSMAATCCCVLLVGVGNAPARTLHFGIAAYLKYFGYPTDQANEANLVTQAGARWVREDFSWASIEPSRGTWDWTQMDNLYRTAATHGLHVLPILDDTACWATPSGTPADKCWATYPAQNSDYADFTAHVVARYGPGGSFWTANPSVDASYASTYFEILNEPYDGSNWTVVSPERYAQLFKAAVIAGRQANPATKYLAESAVDVWDTEPSSTGWVHWAYGMVRGVPDIGNYIDGIAIHPYPGAHDPNYQPINGTDSSFRNTDLIRQYFLDQGINKPIWITEVGYTACVGFEECVPGADQAAREQQKATWLGQLLNDLGNDEYGYVHAVFLWSFRQPDNPDPNVKDDWFQIVDHAGNHLPAYVSYANAAAAFDGTPVPETTIASSGVSGTSMTVSFTSNDPTSTFQCALGASSWQPCTSPKTYLAPYRGATYTVHVRAVNDEAADATPASVRLTVSGSGGCPPNVPECNPRQASG